MIQTLWKIVWLFLKKLSIDLPCNQAIPWVGIYSKELKIENETILVCQCSLQHIHSSKKEETDPSYQHMVG